MNVAEPSSRYTCSMKKSGKFKTIIRTRATSEMCFYFVLYNRNIVLTLKCLSQSDWFKTIHFWFNDERVYYGIIICRPFKPPLRILAVRQMPGIPRITTFMIMQLHNIIFIITHSTEEQYYSGCLSLYWEQSFLTRYAGPTVSRHTGFRSLMTPRFPASSSTARGN